MTIKVTFLKPDEALAAVIRALAAKSAGNQIVSGMTDAYLRENGCYSFRFVNQTQVERFRGFVSNYVSDRFQEILKITDDSEIELYKGVSPLDPKHQAYGLCPQCNSNNTLVRDSFPSRLCLFCGFAEDFENFDIARTAWRPSCSVPKRGGVDWF